MTPKTFLEIIEHGLPGSTVTQFVPAQLVARIEYGGGIFDISGGELNGFPLWLVTSPDDLFNEQTNAVMERLDSISEEYTPMRRTWDLDDVPGLIARLRELAEEDDDAIDPI